MEKRKQLLPITIIVATVMGYSLPSYADDTEVYFGPEMDSVKANVLFVIDVSGSMNYPPDQEKEPSGDVDNRKGTRMHILKESLRKIITNQDTQKLRMGLMTYSTETILELVQPIIDIDEKDTSKDIQKIVSGSKTTLKQKVLVDEDDGWEGPSKVELGAPTPTWVTNKSTPMTDFASGKRTGVNRSSVQLTERSYSPRADYVAFRFNNILVKNLASVGLNKSAISKATLSFYAESTSSFSNVPFKLGVEAVDNSGSLSPELNRDLRARFNASLQKECSTSRESRQKTCDVTDLIQTLIDRPGWKDGNAITIILGPGRYADTSMVHFKESGNVPLLELTVDNKLVAENKKTNKEKLLDATSGLFALGETDTMDAMYQASGYVSNLSKKGKMGPYHFDRFGSGQIVPKSPITEKCQLTHLVLMTDGNPSNPGYGKKLREYMTGSDAVGSPCYIFTGAGKDEYIKDTIEGGEGCGRSFASWMARTPHSEYKADNYIRTHTIAFSFTSGENFLRDLAEYGEGQYYTAKDADSLTEAFQNILSSVMVASSPGASGVVAMSTESKYDQRPEVFYGLYKTSSYDYWPGNVKGFMIDFDNYDMGNGKKAQRAVLKDWAGKNYVIDKNGNFIANYSSAWSTRDSGDSTKGGAVGQLLPPDSRKLYTLFNEEGILNGTSAQLLTSSNSAITTSNLGLTGKDKTEERRKGLLDFIRGYDYQLGGVGGGAKVGQPKLGESSNNGMSLLSYSTGCVNKNILTCPFNQLDLVGFYATNDGFFRAYNLTTGKALYEFMPKEMLPVINKLQKKKGLSREVVKTYALDSSILIIHDDLNKNGIVDGTEKAYAIVAAGRGGRYLYGIDVTSKTSPKLLWTIDNKSTKADFSKLGETWSLPVSGKIKIGSTIKSVIIFGGGYDPQQNTVPFRMKDNMGNALYVVDPATGKLIWSTSDGLDYSIPGKVAILKNKDGLVTDIFFGDMGGQIWRFVVNNGQQGTGIITPGSAKKGLVASISGVSPFDTRRFYGTPLLYQMNDNVVTLNIGTGYRAHPLQKGQQDYFFSFRLPAVANRMSSFVITEDKLGDLDPFDTTNPPSPIEYGYKLKLDKDKGEKVVSNGFADFDRLIFSTFMPDDGTTSDDTCTVTKVGTQRTYYFELSTGKSLLETGYTTSYPSTLPLDAVAYCNDRYCSVISGMDMLSGDVKVTPPSVIPKGGGPVIIKTQWTDLFDPRVTP